MSSFYIYVVGHKLYDIIQLGYREVKSYTVTGYL